MDNIEPSSLEKAPKVVAPLRQEPPVWTCTKCHGKTFSLSVPYAESGEMDYGTPLQFLKRIPPLSELEGEKRDEEITA